MKVGACLKVGSNGKVGEEINLIKLLYVITDSLVYKEKPKVGVINNPVRSAG